MLFALQQGANLGVVRKRKNKRWAIRIAGALCLIAIIGGGWYWWESHHWKPSAGEYPDQGIHIGSHDQHVNFNTAQALGAKFVYLDASIGAQGRDPSFVDNLKRARASELQVGAVHYFNPCLLADGQSSNFVTIVPREDGMLPPAIALETIADDCEDRVPDAAVESELMTFINQVENHVGKPVILKVSPEFQQHYKIAGRLERNLWLERTRFPPEYGGRPWTLWTANASLNSEASSEPIRWVVARP